MGIVNLTPHAIAVRSLQGNVKTFPASGIVARVSASYEEADVIHPPAEPAGDGGFNLESLAVFRQQFGQVENLPAPAAGTVYIVSALVLAALAGSRSDVLAPASGHPGVVRDAKGQIASVPGFVRG